MYGEVETRGVELLNCSVALMLKGDLDTSKEERCSGNLDEGNGHVMSSERYEQLLLGKWIDLRGAFYIFMEVYKKLRIQYKEKHPNVKSIVAMGKS